jgi:hypothetical protein
LKIFDEIDFNSERLLNEVGNTYKLKSGVFCKAHGLNFHFLTSDIRYDFYINAQIVGQIFVKSQKLLF